MKKYLILFALTVLVSCWKEVINEPENGVVELTPISFDLSKIMESWDSDS